MRRGILLRYDGRTGAVARITVFNDALERIYFTLYVRVRHRRNL